MAELRVTSTGTIKLFESDDTSSVTIASPASLGGDRTITLPDANVDLTEVNTMPIANLDIDGGTDIGANIADSDLLIIDDGAGGTNRKTAASRIKTYVGAGAGAFDIANLDIDGGTDIGADIADSDLFIIDDGAGGTNRKVAASRIATYAGGNLVKLASTSDYDGAASELNFTNIFSSTYDNYFVVGFIAPSSDGEIRLRWTTGGTDTDYTTGDYNWVSTTKNVNSSHTLADQDGGYHAESYIPICFADIQADSDASAGSFTFTISDPATTILSRAYVNGTAVYRNAGTAKLYTERFGGANESNVNATGFMLYNSGGNIRDHSVCVYGFKK